jgi:hypothetical protein
MTNDGRELCCIDLVADRHERVSGAPTSKLQNEYAREFQFWGNV